MSVAHPSRTAAPVGTLLIVSRQSRMLPPWFAVLIYIGAIAWGVRLLRTWPPPRLQAQMKELEAELGPKEGARQKRFGRVQGSIMVAVGVLGLISMLLR